MDASMNASNGYGGRVATFLATLAGALLVALACAPPSHAYHFPWDQGHDTTEGEEANDEQGCEDSRCREDECATGSPVYVASGHLVWSETDFQQAGRPGITLRRTYNSNDPRVGLFGNGWSSRCTVALVPGVRWSRDANGITSSQRVFTLRLGSGRRFEFVEDDTGNVVTPPGRFETVEPTNDGGARLIYPDGRISTFNASGRIVRRETRTGEAVLFEYEPSGRLTLMRDLSGRSVQFGYNSNGLVGRVTDNAGQVWRYDYGANGNLIAVTSPAGGVRRYEYQAYEPSGDAQIFYQLTRVTDAAGARALAVTYTGTRVSTYTEGANRFTYRHNAAQATVTKTDLRGSRWTYQYDEYGNVTERTDPAGNTRSIGYDELGRVTAVTERDGERTTYAYDVRGFEVERVEAAGTAQQRRISTEREPKFGLPVRITRPGLEMRMTYDDRGRLLTRTPIDPASGATRTWTYAYHADRSTPDGIVPGRVARIDGPRTDIADVTRFAYTAEGDLASLTNALGHVMRLTNHDARGLPTRMVDPNGTATDLTYDAKSRLVEQATAGATVSYDYDGADRPTRLAWSNGEAMSFEYDAYGRLTAMADAAGNRIEYELDAAGNPVTERIRGEGGEIARTRSRSFDALSRVVRMLGAANQSTEYAYAADGERTAMTDPNGHRTTYAYDALDRLVESVDPLQGRTGYTYDALDRVTAVSDPRGNDTRYTYNAFSDVLRLESPDSGTTTFQRDSAGNPLQRTDANGITTLMSFDALNRRTITDYPGDAHDIRLTYDATAGNGVGRLTNVTHAAGSTAYRYTARGEVAEITNRVEGVAFTAGFEYDDADRLTAITYPSGRRVTFTLDATGRVTDVDANVNGAPRPLAGDIAYRAFGGLTRLTHGNGLTRTATYDRDGRITQIAVPGVLDRSYRYDPAGNITAIDSGTANGLDASYGYDALDRLTQATQSAPAALPGSIAYTYDALGNRTSETVDGARTAYGVDPGSNRLTAIGGATVSHDAAGNRTRDGRHQYRYTPENRLAEVRDTSGVLASYEYNARGQRVLKRTADGATLFVYDTAGRLLGEYTASGAVIREYIHLGLRPLAQIERTDAGERVLHLHTDHLMTPRYATDAAGTVVWSWESSPFGDTAANEDPDGDGENTTVNLRFPGQQATAVNGQNYNLFRVYHSRNGRYLTSDPLGLIAGVNSYRYVYNNPIMFYDPYGLWAWGDPLPQGVVDFSAGFGDAISFGGTDWVRDQMGTNEVVDKCSGFYSGGRYAGYGWGAGLGGAGLVRGYRVGTEISFGRSFRIAPFGNRTGHPTGRYPHYHCRGVDSTGQTLPGQGNRPAPSLGSSIY